MKRIIVFAFLSLIAFSKNEALSQVGEKQTNTTNPCKQGNEYYSNYQFDDALKSLELCFQNDSSDLDCLSKIAQCNYKLGNLADAKKAYNQILSIDSDNKQALNLLANIFSKESRYDKSIEQYEQLILLDSTNSYYYKQYASLSLKLGEIQNAISYFEKALTLNPKDLIVLAELSSIYQQMKQNVRADELIDKGLSIDASNLKLLSLEASSAYKQKKYEKVILSVNKTLSYKNDTSTHMLKLLGVSHFHLDNLDSSIEYLQRVLLDKPDSEIINYYLGMAYRSLGDIDNSVIHLERAINNSISDNISTYYTNLAIAYEENGNYKESIKAYQAAYKTSDDKLLLYHLARNYDVYYKNKETALLYYERYLTENDTNHTDFGDYSKHRITEIKSIRHFELDTLN